MPRRRYDQFCPVARALDAVGERWTLLIVRELLAGPRRYTDLHTDLPGVSTDVLAARLKEMEREELAVRRRLPPPGAAYVYDLTERGRDLLPVLTALAAWGVPALAERRPTDAVRAHWLALPIMRHLGGLPPGVVEVTLDEGAFHVTVGDRAPAYADGPADRPDVRLALDADAALDLPSALRAGRVKVTGEGPLAEALRAAAA